MSINGQVSCIIGLPTPSPSLGEAYHKPVRCQWGTHQAMVDLGCTQTLVHQTMVLPGSLLESEWVEVKCVHGDIHEYHLVPLEIRYKVTSHTLKTLVSSGLILGTDLVG